jgi:hypothetical protein
MQLKATRRELPQCTAHQILNASGWMLRSHFSPRRKELTLV